MSYEIKNNSPKTIQCPYCDKGMVETIYAPSKIETMITRGSGINKTTRIRRDEKYAVIKDCPNCKKSAEQIEKILNSGENKPEPPSNQDIIKRLKDAGLPTKI